MSFGRWKVFAAIALISATAGQASADPFRWMSYEAIDFACKNRNAGGVASGLCLGYIFGIFDDLNTNLGEQERKICTGENDKEKVLLRILSYVDPPKDKKTAADVIYSLAILKAFRNTPCP